ncbi:MAG: hypothetical protein ACYC92_11965 [Candidatus Acidiferrales bacterium]
MAEAIAAAVADAVVTAADTVEIAVVVAGAVAEAGDPDGIEKNRSGKIESSAFAALHKRSFSVTDNLFVQYVGFKVKTFDREYTFNVHISEGAIRAFKLSIPNEAFNAHRARFQDAPSICSTKLHRELAGHGNNPLETNYRISDVDLEEYRTAHPQKSSRNPYARKTN